MVLMGPPGCGKTFLMNILATHALTQGLNVMITALTAQRARELGGIHIHVLFSLRPSGAISVTSLTMAENALMALVRNPTRTAILRKLDVLMIDELGMISMEQLGAINLILQEIRGNTAPFGGLLIFATGEKQFCSFHFSVIFSLNQSTLQKALKTI